MHYKYAFIASCSFIAIVFGPLIPILFLYCLLALISLFLVERAAMTFAYRKPPMYEDDITILILRCLALAPIFYALVALWAFSNQQVFRNTGESLTDMELYPPSNHSFA